MDKPFFNLRPTHNRHRWHMPLTYAVCVGPRGTGFTLGGVGLAAGIAAMQGTCGRPVIWATAQYLSYARPPAVVDLDVRIPLRGEYNTQGSVIGHVGDEEIFTVSRALGERPDKVSRQWIEVPKVPQPDDCPVARVGGPKPRTCTAAWRFGWRPVPFPAPAAARRLGPDRWSGCG